MGVRKCVKRKKVVEGLGLGSGGMGYEGETKKQQKERKGEGDAASPYYILMK